MNPAFAAQLQQITECRYEALLKVEREHIAALRQLIAKGMKIPEVEPAAAAEVLS
jgi:hypothetical protein